MKQKLLNSLRLRLCLLVATLLCVGGKAWGETKTYDFGFTVIGSTGWSNSYKDHIVTYSESIVTFTQSSKQTSTITSYPVTKGNPVTLVMNGNYTISSASFECVQWNSKTQKITLHYSTDGGENYTSTGITSDNFTISSTNLPAGTNAVKITFSSTSNQVGIKGATITYSEGGSTTEACATPTFTPAEGTYTAAQSVTISTATAGAKIYYTTDGTNPTTSSSVYNGAINVSSTTTIKAIAAKDGLDNSAVATAEYIIVNIEHAGTEADPYTVADARSAIDANIGITGVYAKGIVSNIVTPYSSQHSNISFDIVDSEGATETLRAYRCTGTEAANVQVGDVVVVSGNLTKYNDIYEFAQDCNLVSRTSSSTQVAAGLAFSASTASADLANLSAFTAPTLTNPNNLPINYTSSNTSVATVAADGTVTILAEGTTIITATSEETEVYLPGTASYRLTVTNSNKNLVTVDADGNVTFDLSDNGWEFPTSNTTDEKQYTADGYTITLANGHYFNSTGYLMVGKSGATLTLPAFDFPVEKIDVVGRSGASGSVKQNIFVGETAVSTETTGATGTNTYVIAEANRTAGTVYTLKVTSAHNTQITSIKVYKGTIDEREEAGFAFSVETLNITQGQDYTAPTFTNPNNVNVTFSSNNTDVATWNNGLVLGTATGTAVITATFEGDESYKPATATLAVTVREDYHFVDVVIGNGIYEKVTSASELEAGKRYLIVYETLNDDIEDVADVYNGVSESNIGTYVEIARDGSTIDNTVGTAAHPIVLQEAGSGNWYLMDGDNFLYWSSGNSLYSSDDISQTGNTWAITFETDGMDIQNVNTPERYLRFNASSPRFACYAGTQQRVVIYKEKENSEEPVTLTLNSKGYATYASTKDIDFTNAETAGYTAWKVTAINGTDITFEQITGAVEAGTGVLLKGEAGTTITMAFAQTGTDISATNKLVGITEATAVEANTYYGLKGEQFLKVKAGTVPAGKALLRATDVETTTGETKVLNFVFKSEADGVNEMTNDELEMTNIYNLAGQRLQKLQRGVNIVGGKKIVVK